MTGLVLEGGASRTVYSCGILDALLEENIKADYVIGVSAGAAFGASYVSGQIGRNYRLAREIMPTKKYMGFHHLLRPSNKSYYNLDYAFDEVPNSVLPFDYDAYNDYKGRFVAVVTNVETGKAEYLDVPRDDRSWQLLRATCALPMLFPMIRINGVNYLDGGVSDSIPYKQAIAEGCDKLIIVLTRPKGYIKETDTAAKLSADFFKKYPDFAEAMLTRADRYNACMREIEELKQSGKAFVFTPKTTFGVGRLENNGEKLDRLFNYGYNHAKWAMDSLKKYLEIESVIK